MTWVYVLFVGNLVVAVSGGVNPLAQAPFWILGAIIAIHQVARSRQQQRASAILSDQSASAASSASDPQTLESGPELDMFQGLRGWSEDECPAAVASATCALAGRSEGYVRSLLVAASLRDDESGRVVAAAARRLLRPVPASHAGTR
jgi:hypothetical protein